MNILRIKFSQTVHKKSQNLRISEIDLLVGIANDDDNVLRFIYRNYYPGIVTMVYSFKNKVLDPRDIFQEGLTAAILNVKESRFRGSSTFQTYLSSICRNICLKALSKSNNNLELKIDIPQEEDSEPFQEQLIERITFLKSNMEEHCRQILDLRFGINPSMNLFAENAINGQHHRFEKIAEALNIEPDNARQRFKRCFEKLKRALFDDTRWKELVSCM